MGLTEEEYMQYAILKACEVIADEDFEETRQYFVDELIDPSRFFDYAYYAALADRERCDMEEELSERIDSYWNGLFQHIHAHYSGFHLRIDIFEILGFINEDIHLSFALFPIFREMKGMDEYTTLLQMNDVELHDPKGKLWTLYDGIKEVYPYIDTYYSEVYEVRSFISQYPGVAQFMRDDVAAYYNMYLHMNYLQMDTDTYFENEKQMTIGYMYSKEDRPTWVDFLHEFDMELHVKYNQDSSDELSISFSHDSATFGVWVEVFIPGYEAWIEEFSYPNGLMMDE